MTHPLATLPVLETSIAALGLRLEVAMHLKPQRSRVWGGAHQPSIDYQCGRQALAL